MGHDTFAYAMPLSGPVMPAWSPDGSKIAFSDGPIYVMNTDGSGLKQSTNDGPEADQWPSWSPDGSTIAYSNSGTEKIDTSGFSNTQEIWTVPAAGGNPTRLTHNSLVDDMPAYSPDGTQIAYFRNGNIAFMDPTATTCMDSRGRTATASTLGGRPMDRICHLRQLLHSVPLRRRWSDPVRPVANLKTGTSMTLAGNVESTVDDSAVGSPTGNALVVNRYAK